MTDDRYKYPFGIPMTQELCDFMGFSFTAEDYIEAARAAAQSTEENYNSLMTPFRKEISEGFRNLPRFLMNKVRTEFSRINKYPNGDDELVYNFGDVTEVTTWKTICPNWNWR